MTLEEALLVADHGGDCRAALQVLAEAVRTLTADRDSWAEQASQRAQDALDLVAAERERWESAIGAEMPAGFKDWHQNSTTERPTVAAWVIRNLREREAEASAAERERCAQLCDSAPWRYDITGGNAAIAAALADDIRGKA